MAVAFVIGVGGGGGTTRRRGVCTRAADKVAVLWLWRDLRVRDNQALLEASRAKELAVVFVADEGVCDGRDDSNEYLVGCLEELRTELRQRGSELYVRTGDAAEEVVSFAGKAGAQKIYTGESADYMWHERLAQLKSMYDGEVRVVPDAPLRGIKLHHRSEHYSRFGGWSSLFEQQRPPKRAPRVLPPPPSLQASDGDIQAMEKDIGRKLKFLDTRFAEYLEKAEAEDDANCGTRSVTGGADFVRKPGRTIRGLIAQKADLFRSLRFALGFGSVSLAQVAAAGARGEAAQKDWYRRMSISDTHHQNAWRFWCWRGCFVRFRAEGALSDPTAPAVLLVHGFGASVQHYSKNFAGLRDKHVKVYGLDLIGFGRTEKPRTQYTQHLWEAQIASFVREVVRQPVYIVGNSIGGYMSMSFAADHHPTLCRGAVLVNSAGNVGSGPSVSSSLEKKAKERSELLVTISKSFIFLLQPQIQSILKRLYPVRPEAVSKELVRDIYRDSTDPGAAYVLESGIRLPNRRTLDDLFSIYDGPLLVLQGAKDPLNDAVARAKAIKAAYARADVELLDAGHCPHDEVPEEFDEKLLAWVQRCEKKLAAAAEAKELAK